MVKFIELLRQHIIKGLPYLGVIFNSNVQGVSAQYQHNAINLRRNNSTQALPSFIQSFFDQTIDIINASTGIVTSNYPYVPEVLTLLNADEIVGADYQ